MELRKCLAPDFGKDSSDRIGEENILWFEQLYKGLIFEFEKERDDPDRCRHIEFRGFTISESLKLDNLSQRTKARTNLLRWEELSWSNFKITFEKWCWPFTVIHGSFCWREFWPQTDVILCLCYLCTEIARIFCFCERNCNIGWRGWVRNMVMDVKRVILMETDIHMITGIENFVIKFQILIPFKNDEPYSQLGKSQWKDDAVVYHKRPWYWPKVIANYFRF